VQSTLTQLRQKKLPLPYLTLVIYSLLLLHNSLSLRLDRRKLEKY